MAGVGVGVFHGGLASSFLRAHLPQRELYPDCRLYARRTAAATDVYCAAGQAVLLIAKQPSRILPSQREPEVS